MADYSGLVIEPGKLARFTRADHFKSGETGDAVEQLNLFLIQAGYLTEEELAKQGGRTDIVGTGTKNAAIYFQRDQGIPEDGDRNHISADELRAFRSFISSQEGVEVNAEVYTGNAGGRELLNNFGLDAAPPVTKEPPEKATATNTAENTLSILTSRDMKWYFDPATDQWAVGYKLPNSDRSVVFAATGKQLDAIFGDGQRPTSFEEVGFAELTQREGVTFAGDIAEVEGTGTFEGEVDRVIALALDEGILPKWAQGSGAVYDLLFIAQSENKSSEWLVDELAKLPEFKARFPGIEAMTGLGLSTTEAVTGFLELESGVQQLILRDGGDPASVTPDMIGDLLAKGHSLLDVESTFNIFDRLEKNQGALDAFNEVLVAQGKDPLTAEDQFEFMAGTAPTELYDIWEQSSLHQAAIDAGLDIGVDAAISLAARTEGLTSYDTAMSGLNNAATNLLRFREEIGMDQFDLNEQDLIDLSLGLAPSSGTSQAEIGRNMERAFSAAKAKRERSRVNPFKRFTDAGVPQAASLSGLRQEGG